MKATAIGLHCDKKNKNMSNNLIHGVNLMAVDDKTY